MTVLLLATLHALTAAHVPVDLEVYRRGGELVLAGTDALYANRSGLLPFTYPPLAAMLFVPLSALPPLLATLAMALLSYAALAVLVHLTWVRTTARNPMWGAALVLAAALLEPVAETVRFGQVNLVLAALVAVDVLVLMPNRHPVRGALLALAICVKLTPAAFLLVPIARRDWSSLARVMVVAGVTTMLPALLVPHSWREFFAHAVWDPQRVGGVEYLSNQSVTGAVWRAVGLGGAPTLTTALTALVVAVTVVALLRTRAADAVGALALTALCGLLVSPISWVHHWVWMVPLVGWLVARAARASGALRLGLVTLAGAWVVVATTRLLWLTPSGDRRELVAAPVVKLVADSYTVLGLVSLIVLAVLLRRTEARVAPVGADRPAGAGA